MCCNFIIIQYVFCHAVVQELRYIPGYKQSYWRHSLLYCSHSTYYCIFIFVCAWSHSLSCEKRSQLGSFRIDCFICNFSNCLLHMAWSYNKVINSIIFKLPYQDYKFHSFCRHHIRTMKKWQESHQCVELISVRGIAVNIEGNNNNSPVTNQDVQIIFTISYICHYIVFFLKIQVVVALFTCWYKTICQVYMIHF